MLELFSINYNYDELYAVSRKSLLTILLFISVNGLAQDSGKQLSFRLINNHIYIPGTLNDTLPVWILLDCGAGTILSEGQAKKGKIKTHSPGQTQGIGNNMVPYEMTDSVRFTLGGFSYSEKGVPVLSFKEIERCAAFITVDEEGKLTVLNTQKDNAQPIDAVLGDKFFRRFVVKIDFQKEVLTLYDPSSFKYAGKGDRIPLLYSDNHIYARASITQSDSLVSGYFMVDCGSMTGVVLNTPFIKKHGLTPSTGATELSLCGIGGNSQSMMGNVPDFRIGKQRIEKPITLFSRASSGVLTRPDVAGSIGNGILRKFVVILDYSRKEMILE